MEILWTCLILEILVMVMFVIEEILNYWKKSQRERDNSEAQKKLKEMSLGIRAAIDMMLLAISVNGMVKFENPESGHMRVYIYWKNVSEVSETTKIMNFISQNFDMQVYLEKLDLTTILDMHVIIPKYDPLDYWM